MSTATATSPRPVSIRRQGWRHRAACNDVDPGLFFPPDGGSAQPAKAICAGCPVKAECLEYALVSGQRFGVWAGLDERERQGMSPKVVRSDFCGKGLHVMDEKNAYVNPVTGKRYCKACKADYRCAHETQEVTV
jgi:WhiB family transcriptional regulator, redox-sensing transcriptional regulator